MNLRRIWQLAVLTLGVAGFAAGPLLASPITFDFSGGGGATAHDYISFTQGSLTITAFGYVGATGTNLYLKDTGTTEDGLGLDVTRNDEINPNQAIIFDVSELVGAGITGGTFTLGSLQSGEAALACVLGSGTPPPTPNYSPSSGCGNPLTENPLTPGIGSVTVNWGSNDYVEFLTAPHPQNDTNGNFLVDTLAVDTTPEPPSLILFGTMLLGLALVGRRRWATLLG